MQNADKYGYSRKYLRDLEPKKLQTLEEDLTVATDRLRDFLYQDDQGDDFEFNFVTFEDSKDKRNVVLDLRQLGTVAKQQLENFIQALHTDALVTRNKIGGIKK